MEGRKAGRNGLADRKGSSGERSERKKGDVEGEKKEKARGEEE